MCFGNNGFGGNGCLWIILILIIICCCCGGGSGAYNSGSCGCGGGCGDSCC